ncbi:hypothetical protein LXA43DRAFT_1103350 [Ganoderma leucocontextum]|nr:hypothetical protein LXA43DRAFT_1103350 [Ganoderma leucocontextum]
MTPVAAVLFVSLILARASIAGPILSRRAAPTTVDSPSALMSTSTSSTDVPPTPVFTFGPSRLPHVSAPTTASAPASTLVLEMDWLS